MNRKILEELKEAVVVGNVEKARRMAEYAVNQGIQVGRAVKVLMKAMKIVGVRYEKKEYFVIDVASSATAMKEAFKVFEPHLKPEPYMKKGKIVIGSLKGNIQSLGKDIVAATLQSAGFHVVNLGEDVAPEEFAEAAVREKAQIIALSISMEETIPRIKEVVDLLRKENLRDKIKVVIGGNAVSEQVRRRYGIDAYAVDAEDCLKKVRALLN